MESNYRKNLARLAIAFGSVAAWEVASRWWETLKAERGYDYWRIYYDDRTNERGDRIRELHTIRSTGVNLHIDVYPNRESDAPVVIFNHGAAGYCRLFVQLALAFIERGYTVVAPDQRGQGLSGGVRGDYAITECAQNIVDVARWAKNRFDAPLFIAGGSAGGALTYYAAAAGAPANAIACLNLFDFGPGGDGLQISRLAPVARNYTVVNLFTGGLALLKPVYWLRIPFNWMEDFDKLMDERDALFQSRWDADPIPPRLISLRSLASHLTTAPATPFEQNRVPALVVNQSQDQMVDPEVTHRNYKRLGGPKRYLEIPFGHWSSQPDFWGTIVPACDEWFKQHQKPAG